MRILGGTPIALAALCMLVEGFLPLTSGIKTTSAAATIPHATERADEQGSGSGDQLTKSPPSGVVPLRRIAPMMPLRRAYDMLNQLERDFFGLTPFAEIGEDFQLAPFDEAGTAFMSPTMGQLDVSETDKEWKVSVDLPGLKKEDVHIELDNHILNISAERKAEKEHKGQNFVRKERSFGTVSRTLRLPDNVDEDNSKVKAKFDHGVLHITLEKLHDAKPKSSGKRIEIQ